MPEMTLKTALTLAKTWAGKSAEDGHNLTTIDAKGIRSRNGVTGVFVPMALDLPEGREARVDAYAAYRMVAKVGATAGLSLKRQVEIAGARGTFTLTTTTKHGWKMPRAPLNWRPLSQNEADALSVAAMLSSKAKGDPLAVVHMTPHLSMSRRFTSAATVYVKPVAQPVTVTRDFLLKCPAGQIGQRDNHVFIQTPDGVLFWTRALEGSYPADRIYRAISDARSRQPDSAVFAADLRHLLPLAERAAAACRVPADAGWLIIEGDNASIHLSSDLGGYVGGVPVVGDRTAERRRVGIRPHEFLRFLKAFKGMTNLDCAVSGERSAIHMWTTGEPAIEVLLEPVFVP